MVRREHRACHPAGSGHDSGAADATGRIFRRVQFPRGDVFGASQQPLDPPSRRTGNVPAPDGVEVPIDLRRELRRALPTGKPSGVISADAIKPPCGAAFLSLVVTKAADGSLAIARWQIQVPICTLSTAQV